MKFTSDPDDLRAVVEASGIHADVVDVCLPTCFPPSRHWVQV